MFCVDNSIAVKHTFSPQMVKNLFALDNVPEEITIEPLENNEYYIGSQKKNSKDSGSCMSKYVIDTVEEGARICYKSPMPHYWRELV